MKKRCSQFYILLLLAIAPHVLCAQKISKDGFKINGVIHGVKDGTMVKLVDIEEQTVLDSAAVSKGQFVLKGKVSVPTSCWLQCGEEYAILEVENLNMQFSSPLKEMRLNCKVSGGKEQDLQNKLAQLQRPFDLIAELAQDSLRHKKYENDTEKNKLIQVIDDAEDTSSKIYLNFGKAHIDSYVGIDIVYRNRKKIEKDTVAALYKKLGPNLKKTAKAAALKIYMSENMAEVNKMAIDFSAKTIDGKLFQLSSLKGEYVYLSFGGAGCAPCRMENKDISANFDRLSKKLTFVYFSIDKNMEAWKEVTNQDKIVWHNVSDMEGGIGRIKTIYDVQAIPTSFLIDKSGLIIKRFNGFNPSILSQLEKIITSKNK